jgi:hypothetical protein
MIAILKRDLLRGRVHSTGTNTIECQSARLQPRLLDLPGMVVNRKQQIVSVPPISRSSSSQPLPTKRLSRILPAVANVQAGVTPQNDAGVRHYGVYSGKIRLFYVFFSQNIESTPASDLSEPISAKSAKVGFIV